MFAAVWKMSGKKFYRSLSIFKSRLFRRTWQSSTGMLTFSGYDLLHSSMRRTAARIANRPLVQTPRRLLRRARSGVLDLPPDSP
jgi:hypothetical protein